jgi:hypothetical protein
MVLPNGDIRLCRVHRHGEILGFQDVLPEAGR